MRAAVPYFLITLFLAAYLPQPSHGYGEPNAQGRPVYQERASHTLLNAVRIDPVNYKAIYMAGYTPSPASILTNAVYPPVPPLYGEILLFDSAYNHSNDMVVNGCFQHPSCDGTDTFTRINSFYTCYGTGEEGENIAAGEQTPLDTNNQWLCDSTDGTTCAPDGNGDGHRSNFMLVNYGAIGVGYQYGASTTYKYYWTQDFGGQTCTAVTNPIYSASHTISGTTIKYVAIYYTTPAAAPTTATVNVGGTSYNLALELGAAGRASYTYSGTVPSGCVNYFFSFTSGTNTYRYPDTGCLVTTSSSCTTSFANCSTASTASAAATVASSGAAASGAAASGAAASGATASGAAASGATSTTTAGKANLISSAVATNPLAYYLLVSLFVLNVLFL